MYVVTPDAVLDVTSFPFASCIDVAPVDLCFPDFRTGPSMDFGRRKGEGFLCRRAGTTEAQMIGGAGETSWNNYLDTR